MSEFDITATEGANSNRVSGSLYTPSGSTVPTYDADGNLTQDHLWVYTWNSDNRLESQEHRNDVILGPLVRTKMNYTYDSQGRRMRRITSKWDAALNTYVVNQDLRYLYDGWNLLAEIDASDELIRDYVWGLDLSGSVQGAGGVGGLLSVDDGSTVTLAFYDGNGNVMGYTDAYTGTVLAEYEYDPFGRQIKTIGTLADSFPHRFSTKYQDEETGLLYYGFRYYDPETGRWPNRDPIGELGGKNIYSFIENNALDASDLYGLRTFREEHGYQPAPEHYSIKELSNPLQTRWGNSELARNRSITFSFSSFTSQQEITVVSFSLTGNIPTGLRGLSPSGKIERQYRQVDGSTISRNFRDTFSASYQLQRLEVLYDVYNTEWEEYSKEKVNLIADRGTSIRPTCDEGDILLRSWITYGGFCPVYHVRCGRPDTVRRLDVDVLQMWFPDQENPQYKLLRNGQELTGPTEDLDRLNRLIDDDWRRSVENFIPNL